MIESSVQHFNSEDETTDDDIDTPPSNSLSSSPSSKERPSPFKSSYNLGTGKNKPLVPTRQHLVKGAIKENLVMSEVNDPSTSGQQEIDNQLHWIAHIPVNKRTPPSTPQTEASYAPKSKIASTASSRPSSAVLNLKRTRKMVPRTDEGRYLRAALWDEGHFSESGEKEESVVAILATTATTTPEGSVSNVAATATSSVSVSQPADDFGGQRPKEPERFYPDLDLSIPKSIYSTGNANPLDDRDVVWDLMRWEAFQEAQREPLLVSFLYSTILNHPTLESSLAFMLANRLSSPAMISTQVQSLILEAQAQDPSIARSLRADIMAVRDRDPACTCLPDVFLYFKGFHALQTYRVAHAIWKTGKHILAHYLQSQMSQIFQIDIHPNATLGSGIMLDHGTGIVIGETARVGHNCSILHHVTLGGSGKKGVDRHPKVGDGVLLGAGASVLGNIKIGSGCQIGAGTLVITDLPSHSVAVGVPAKVIGSFMDVSEQPSIGMNQLMDQKIVTFQSDGI
jgi:serine O-acetyltransferase